MKKIIKELKKIKKELESISEIMYIKVEVGLDGKPHGLRDKIESPPSTDVSFIENVEIISKHAYFNETTTLAETTKETRSEPTHPKKQSVDIIDNKDNIKNV